jgi:hypothetical protein
VVVLQEISAQLISLDFRVLGLQSAGMKILLLVTVVQALTLVVSAWFNREAGLRILVLRYELAVYKRKSEKPSLKNRDRLLWSLMSKIWTDWTSELILARPETVIRWRKRKFREFWSRQADVQFAMTVLNRAVTLRARWRELETELRRVLFGRAGGNPGYRQGHSKGYWASFLPCRHLEAVIGFAAGSSSAPNRFVSKSCRK